MSGERGLICAYVFDGRGGARNVGWEGVTAWAREQGVLWMHFDRTDSDARQWLRESSGVDPVITSALLGKGSRPRSLLAKDGLLVILRGVNLNPDEDPVDMVSIRMFVQAGRIISLCRQNLMAVDDIRTSLAEGVGPCDAGDFTIMIAERLINRISAFLTDLHDELDRFERQTAANATAPERDRLANLRRRTINLYRDLAPQREALTHLQDSDIDWLDGDQRLRLDGINDQLTRYVQNLDACSERAEVVHDQITDSMSEQINRNMYILSIAAALFLPLDFISGLFGMNVAGIPARDNPWIFVVIVLGLVAMAGVLVLAFMRIGMIRPIRRLGSG